ncbi:CO/xanthine dehydrogenase Mo-binding subunit/aerobic-type carbon monoxide dehydrogenase small subunit (CoxS/CutS family) [Nitrobacteraceae bacterium AZCC 2161]
MSLTQQTLSFTLDGERVTLAAGSPRVLSEALSQSCGRPGVRVACDHGVCGACTVLVDGRPFTSCSTFVDTIEDREVTTVQGLSPAGLPSGTLQQAFVEAHAFQCGMCTPGMVLLAEALLARHPDPSRDQIRSWMSANVCRCTGYQVIEEAVIKAVGMRSKTSNEGRRWRPEETAKVTGQPFFLVDTHFPNTAEIKILRSPHPHARIAAIDVTQALALPGVLAIVTGDDLLKLPAHTYGLWIKDQPLLAVERVRHIGEPVAAVAAVDAVTAIQALSCIVVTYDVLPAVATPAEAMAPGAPLLFDDPSLGAIPAHGISVATAMEHAPNVLYEFHHCIGDVDAAFAAADHIFTDEFAFSRMAHVHLEPSVTMARPLGDGVEVWSCNQDPFLLRQEIAEICGLPEHAVRVRTLPIGGGFGAKSYCKIEPLVVLLALRINKAARLTLTMDESISSLSQHAATLRLETAVSKDGDFQARRSNIVLDGGAYADASPLVADKVGYRIGGPYRWLALDSKAIAVRTNTVPAGSFRGFGGTQASWASESQVDMIARRLGIDPLDIRRRNLLLPGEPYRAGDSVIDSDLVAGLDLVAEKIEWGVRSSSNKPHLAHGKGLAIGFKDGGGQGRFAQARVKVTADGSAIINCATVDMGQGATEAFRRIVAGVLKLDPERIARAAIDTDQTAFDQGTHASSATAVTGEAIRRAAVAVLDRILTFAADQLGCAKTDLDFVDGHIRRGNTATPLVSLVRGYYGGMGAEFAGDGEFKIEVDSNAALNAPIVYWMPNWVSAEVEVDTQTGKVTVLKLVSMADAGRALVPEAVRGQIEGASIQGLSQALFEQLVFDGARLVTATPQQYRVPVMSDVPAVFESVVLEQGLARGPLGAKGVGEAGILGVASAIANAVEDAVGVRITSLPLSPDKVLAALEAKCSHKAA